jgi:hypothetical protein
MLHRRILRTSRHMLTVLAGMTFVLPAATMVARAQVLSFSADGTRRLTELVAGDADAAGLLRTLQRNADEALQQSPHPAKQLLSEGRLESDPAKQQTAEALHDMPKLYALAQSYRITGEPRYADGTKKYLLAWATTTEPTGNPIDATNLDSLIVAYDLTRAAMSAAERKTVDAWLGQIALQQINERKPNAATSFNNWNSHRLKLVGLIGFVLQDRQLVETALDGFRQQVAADLMPDGSSYDFHERDAMHYHCYTLDPLLVLAIAAHQNGVRGLYQYTAPNGASLAKSVAFLLPYAQGKLEHAEFVNSHVDFDRRRGAAGQKGYQSGTAFDPKSARRTIELASFFEPQLGELAAQLIGKPERRYANWQMVLNEVGRHEQLVPPAKRKSVPAKRGTKK